MTRMCLLVYGFAVLSRSYVFWVDMSANFSRAISTIWEKFVLSQEGFLAFENAAITWGEVIILLLLWVTNWCTAYIIQHFHNDGGNQAVGIGFWRLELLIWGSNGVLSLLSMIQSIVDLKTVLDVCHRWSAFRGTWRYSVYPWLPVRVRYSKATLLSPALFVCACSHMHNEKAQLPQNMV